MLDEQSLAHTEFPTVFFFFKFKDCAYFYSLSFRNSDNYKLSLTFS